jgi:hypothetical protein
MTIAERILSAYAEPWTANHDAGLRCFEVEQVLAAGNLAFELVIAVDAAWQDHVAAGDLPFTEEDDRRIGDLYRQWVEVSERNQVAIAELIEGGCDLKGADEFLTHLEEARSILESRSLEAEMRPIEELLPLARGNPRPERYGP